MAIETKAEALAFVEAMRLTVKGKRGFSWLTEELDELHAFIERTSCEDAGDRDDSPRYSR
jgi:predicted transcriptional regulator